MVFSSLQNHWKWTKISQEQLFPVANLWVFEHLNSFSVFFFLNLNLQFLVFQSKHFVLFSLYRLIQARVLSKRHVRKRNIQLIQWAFVANLSRAQWVRQTRQHQKRTQSRNNNNTAVNWAIILRMAFQFKFHNKMKFTLYSIVTEWKISTKKFRCNKFVSFTSYIEKCFHFLFCL